MALRIRQLTDDEKQYFRELANSPSAPMRVLQRAFIVWLSAQGKRVPIIAREVGVSEHTVRVWLTRFRDHGVKGLDDLPRPGAERKYNHEQVAEICRVAQATPGSFGLPFSYWTLDRLVEFLHEQRKITVKRSRLNEILREEAVLWQGTRERRDGVSPQTAATLSPRRSALLCGKRPASRTHRARRPLPRRPHMATRAVGLPSPAPRRDQQTARSSGTGEPTQVTL